MPKKKIKKKWHLWSQKEKPPYLWPTNQPQNHKIMTNLLTKLTPTAQGQIASLSFENKTMVKNILKTNASTLTISIEDIYAVMSKIGFTNNPIVDFMGLFVYQNGQEMYDTIIEVLTKDIFHKHGVTA